MRNFKVNTVGGSHEMSLEDIKFLKDEIKDFNNLVIMHYERPTSFGSPISNKPYKIQTYSCGEPPKGMEDLVNQFDERQQNLFASYWSKLANKINFAGTKIYYTHIQQIAELYKIAKRISKIKTSEDYVNELQNSLLIERNNTKFFTYTHIIQDILEQLKKE